MTNLGVSVEFGQYPGFLPGTAIAIIVALLVAGPVARRLDTSQGVAWLLVVSLGTILMVTLTPGGDGALSPFSAQRDTCDLARIGPDSLSEYRQLGESAFNVFLFIPFGLALALLPGSRRRGMFIVAAIALPFVIEATQLAATPLGRACQSADVVDNLLGLAIGLAAGLTWKAVAVPRGG